MVKFVRKQYPHIRQGLTTNGFLVPALKHRVDREDVLTALDEVDVSLDFAEDRKHNAFRGNTRAYEWALDCINACRSKGMTTTIVVLGITETLHVANLDRIFQIARGTGCFVRINIFRPNAGQDVRCVPYMVLYNALKWIVGQHRVVSLSDPLFSALVLQRTAMDGSGLFSLRILPDGSITPSTYLVEPKFRVEHIQSADLEDREIITRLCKPMGNRYRLPNECDKCPAQTQCCGGALDRRLVWYRTLEERDPYCPFRHNDTHHSWRMEEVREMQGILPNVHVGYLPTLIFAPEEFGNRSERVSPEKAR